MYRSKFGCPNLAEWVAGHLTVARDAEQPATHKTYHTEFSDPTCQ